MEEDAGDEHPGHPEGEAGEEGEEHPAVRELLDQEDDDDGRHEDVGPPWLVPVWLAENRVFHPLLLCPTD